jgi:hypothetical protein
MSLHLNLAPSQTICMYCTCKLQMFDQLLKATTVEDMNEIGT